MSEHSYHGATSRSLIFCIDVSRTHPLTSYQLLNFKLLILVCFVAYTYFNAYIHLRFKHAALGTYLSCWLSI